MANHSPDFIAEMKTKLTQERDQLAARLKTMAHESGGENQANFPDYGRSEEDNATEIGDYVATAATEEAIEDRLHNIEAALERIEAGTYGLTSDGELIPEERLRANPSATTIVKK